MEDANVAKCKEIILNKWREALKVQLKEIIKKTRMSSMTDAWGKFALPPSVFLEMLDIGKCTLVSEAKGRSEACQSFFGAS